MALNHVDQNFMVEAPGKVWVSDMTCVATEENWLYVAVVVDLFSRKIIGLGMGDKLEINLVIKALEQALCRREGSNHHVDRGSQCTSKEFKELTDLHGIKLSVSGKGCCYDNAVAESFFHTLKTEETFLYDCRIREET